MFQLGFNPLNLPRHPKDGYGQIKRVHHRINPDHMNPAHPRRIPTKPADQQRINRAVHERDRKAQARTRQHFLGTAKYHPLHRLEDGMLPDASWVHRRYAPGPHYVWPEDNF